MWQLRIHLQDVAFPLSHAIFAPHLLKIAVFFAALRSAVSLGSRGAAVSKSLLPAAPFAATNPIRWLSDWVRIAELPQVWAETSHIRSLRILPDLIHRSSFTAFTFSRDPHPCWRHVNPVGLCPCGWPAGVVWFVCRRFGRSSPVSACGSLRGRTLRGSPVSASPRTTASCSPLPLTWPSSMWLVPVGSFFNSDRELNIGLVVRMLVSGYRGCLFKSRHQYVVSLSKILYLHCISRLSCEMSIRWWRPHEGCSVLWAFQRNSN